MARASMKTIGLLGGMSWESTALYYRLLNAGVNAALGGHHNARSVLYTFDFEELLRDGLAGRWDLVGDALAEAARRLAGAGADFLLITSNTGHAVADRVAEASPLPLLHIADAAAAAVKARGLARPALIGTRFAMEMGFYTDRLRARHGLETILPGEADRVELQRIIIDELTLGDRRPQSRRRCQAIVEALAGQGADSVIVGCTELPLLLAEDDYGLPAFDTTRLHVEEAIRHALAG